MKDGGEKCCVLVREYSSPAHACNLFEMNCYKFGTYLECTSTRMITQILVQYSFTSTHASFKACILLVLCVASFQSTEVVA